MISIFEQALAVADPIQDAFYGESFLIEPQTTSTDVNARAGADPNRTPQTITAVWSEPQAELYPHNRTRHPDADSARVSDTKPTIDFDTAALPYALLQNDRVTRQGDGLVYFASDVTDDGFTRTVATLTAAKGS